MDRYNEVMAYGVHWLLAVSGVLLICMAAVNFLRRQSQNSFAWGSSLNRAFIGVTLILIGGSTSKLIRNKTWLYWM